MLASAGWKRQMLERERERVAAASRRLAKEGLVLGTAGNISERAGDHVAITPTGAVLAELEPDDITVVDLHANHAHGELAATSEVSLHLGVYERYDAGAVVHTHAPMGTALSCVLDELPVIHYQMLTLGGAVRVAPYATFGTPELAELTLDALSERSAALMANHGTITYGPDVDFAAAQSLLLEWACELYWRAAVVGAPKALDSEAQQAVIDQVMQRGYGSTQRVEP
jgi:L-fuculose-phosphate aldolase